MGKGVRVVRDREGVQWREGERGGEVQREGGKEVEEKRFIAGFNFPISGKDINRMYVYSLPSPLV